MSWSNISSDDLAAGPPRGNVHASMGSRLPIHLSSHEDYQHINALFACDITPGFLVAGVSNAQLSGKDLPVGIFTPFSRALVAVQSTSDSIGLSSLTKHGA